MALDPSSSRLFQAGEDAANFELFRAQVLGAQKRAEQQSAETLSKNVDQLTSLQALAGQVEAKDAEKLLAGLNDIASGLEKTRSAGNTFRLMSSNNGQAANPENAADSTNLENFIPSA